MGISGQIKFAEGRKVTSLSVEVSQANQGSGRWGDGELNRGTEYSERQYIQY